MSRYPNDLSGNRKSISTGFGVRIGYYGELLQNFYVGASFQTKMYMSEFDEYKGLFAEQGDFDVPANWTVGIAFKPNDKLTFAFDVQQILYSGIKSINNPLEPAKFQQGILLGDDKGAGFGWEDIFIFKFGLIYKVLNDLGLMLGYSYNQNPIPDDQVLFNILAPAVIQHHITFGASKTFSNHHALNIGFMFAPSGSVEGTNTMEIPGQQRIEIKMYQWQIELGYGFH